MKEKTGFTLLELIIVLAIFALLAGVTAVSLSSLNGEQALDKATLTVWSVLNAARSSAVSSKDASNQGVRIFSNQIVAFEGSYGTKNATTTFSNLIKISTSTGIGTDIIFQELFGNTTASGTITVSLKSNASQNEIIRVYGTGAIEKK